MGNPLQRKNKIKLIQNLAVFSFAFFIAYACGSHFMPVDESSASETSNNGGTYYANITSNGNIDVAVDSTPDGTLGIGTDNLTVDTNATSGYKLYIGMNKPTDISTLSTSNRLYLDGDSSSGSYLSPSAGTIATPIKLAGNTWGYVASRTNSSQSSTDYSDATKDSEIFSGVPVYGDENVLYTNTTPTTSSTNSLDIYYGVNISTALPSGTYEGTVAYTAIVDATLPSSADTATISPVSQNGLEAGPTITITTELYPGFSADNMGDITVTIGTNTCTSPTPSIDATNGNLIITCTAPAQANYGTYDVQVEITKYNKVYTLTGAYEYINPIDGYMHEFNCSSLASVNDTARLEDIRDGTVYTVAKLADGNCWMVEDLKLGGDEDMTLTSTYSNVASNFTLKAENTGTWCTINDSTCDDQSMMIKTGVPNGYLYNWYAATAGTGTYSMSSGTTTYNICPKGWTLPTGGASSDFVTLSTSYGGPSTNQGSQQTAIANLMASPVPGFNYTGNRNGGSTNYTTTDSYYWSRTAFSNINAYDLYFGSSGVLNPQSNNRKWLGLAIRCVAKTADTIATMQDMDSTICSNLAVGDALTLTDTRDSKTYTVKKLVDGKCWMTQNLRLVGSYTLTSSDSNVSSNFNLTATDGFDVYDAVRAYDTGNTSYGAFYNWYTATAGSGTTSVSSGSVSYSICPKNWRLPTSTEWNTLYTSSDSSASNMLSTSGGYPGLVLSGLHRGSTTNYQGSYGYFWSSTAYNANVAYNLYLNSSDVYPQGNGSKAYGFSIRCVAD